MTNDKSAKIETKGLNAQAMAWIIGQKLHNGQYTIEKTLGKAGFGITYLATDAQGNKLVIKTLNEDRLKQLTPVRRESLKCKFVDEARRLEVCKHPHVVKVYKTFVEGQWFCLAMEYIRGRNLGNLSQRVLPEKEALSYIQQMGEALIAAHQQGLLHRNVKPANIMVRASQYEAVLIDFDLGGKFEYPLILGWQDEVFAPIELKSKTRSHGTCTDVYSLAATLYVLLTGKLPATSSDRQKGKADLIPPKQINPQISKRVNKAILAGMKLEPEARPKSVLDWLKLLGVQRGGVISGLAKPPRWAMVVGILGVVGIAAGVVSASLEGMGFWEKFIPESSPDVNSSTSSPLYLKSPETEE
ncbi:serine/threonine protein kinase [Coleofasciculus sp. G2-EDA-02]|uniref:serine/threonine protein kinase n=1 Tax=Coleofasciculus sp. G2-EDA-02 TaxID=3069529 RepID=UPI003302EF61